MDYTTDPDDNQLVACTSPLLCTTGSTEGGVVENVCKRGEENIAENKREKEGEVDRVWYGGEKAYLCCLEEEIMAAHICGEGKMQVFVLKDLKGVQEFKQLDYKRIRVEHCVHYYFRYELPVPAFRRA